MRKIGVSALMTFAVLGGSALAQGTPDMPAGAGQSSPNATAPSAGPQQNADCVSMRQQVMSALTEKASSPNAAVAQQAIAAGDKACATGDTLTAQGYYQKALILLNSS